VISSDPLPDHGSDHLWSKRLSGHPSFLGPSTGDLQGVLSGHWRFAAMTGDLQRWTSDLQDMLFVRVNRVLFCDRRVLRWFGFGVLSAYG